MACRKNAGKNLLKPKLSELTTKKALVLLYILFSIFIISRIEGLTLIVKKRNKENWKPLCNVT